MEKFANKTGMTERILRSTSTQFEDYRMYRVWKLKKEKQKVKPINIKSNLYDWTEIQVTNKEDDIG